MKSTCTLLTLLAAAIVIAPRQSSAQYTWVPVYSNQAAPTGMTPSGTAPANAAFDANYATHIGDGDGEEAEHASQCGLDCDCPTCRHSEWRARAYVGIEYLHWYNKARTLPPLLTGGSPSSTAFSDAGVLPGAPVLFGGKVGSDLKSGGRLTGGLWIDDCRSHGLVVRAYGTEGDSNSFGSGSFGNPILAVPFIDQSANPAFNGEENALVLAYAGGLTPGITQMGSATVESSNDIWGGDAFYRMLVDEGCDYRLDLLAGYQMTRIDDDLVLTTQTQVVSALGQPTFQTEDYFDVENEFHGGLIGVMGEFFNGPLTVQMMGKIGMGNMHQTASINGNYTITDNIGLVDEGAGGLFAQPSQAPTGPRFNIGNYEQDLLVFSPEASIKAIYCVSQRLSVTVGYSFLYWSRVALSGDQIDRDVNRDVTFGGTFLPGGGPNPTFSFIDTDFWVQTIDIGLLLNY
jgi:hypothetical protein